MRRDAAFLDDILQACDQIQQLCDGKGAAQVEADPVRRAALLHHLTVIGEAAARLSNELRARHATLPWPEIISQRNRIVHGYFGIDWNIVWHSATRGVPVLREWTEKVLREEFPGEAIG
jgi:uncharacterized protein with HEPN domain